MLHGDGRLRHKVLGILQTTVRCSTPLGGRPDVLATAHTVAEWRWQRCESWRVGGRPWESFPVLSKHRDSLNLHHHPGQRQTGQRHQGDGWPDAVWRTAVRQDMPSDIGEKGGFVHTAIGGIKRHQLNDIGQPRPKFPQNRIDVSDDHSRLGRQIKGMQRLASSRLVNLPSHKGHLAGAHAVLESQMLIPIPVALWPCVAACGHSYYLRWMCSLAAIVGGTPWYRQAQHSARHSQGEGRGKDRQLLRETARKVVEDCQRLAQTT